MFGYVLVGVVTGVGLGILEARHRAGFRKKFRDELESQARQGKARRYVMGIVQGKTRWMKSFSIVRKPFGKEINLLIETGALLLCCLAIVNSLVNFNTQFSSLTQGIATLAFLGGVLGYIPGEWIFGGRVEKEMEGLVQELEEVLEKGELDRYVAEVTRDSSPV